MALIKQTEKEFKLHPITDDRIRAVVVDVTKPFEQDDSYHPGEKKTTFRIVLETEMKGEDGKNLLMFSRPLTAKFSPATTKYPASNLFLLVQKIIGGRDISKDEGFDPDQAEGIIIIGRSVLIEVEHNKKDDKVYDNLSYIKADNSADKMAPSGNYVRWKDKSKTAGSADEPAREYNKAPQAPEPEAPTEWSDCAVHVGQFKGQKLGALPEANVRALIEHWVPTVGVDNRATADDKRLVAALATVEAILNKTKPAF